MLKRVILFGVLFFSFSVVFSKVKYEDSEYYKMLNLGAVAEEDRVEIQEQLEELLPEDVISDLLETGKARKTVYKSQNPKLTCYPDNMLGREASEFVSKIQSVFLVESLYLYKKPESAKEVSVKEVGKILRSLSTLKGIQYYSETSNKFKELYKESYVTEKSNKKVVLPDPVGDLTGELEIYALMEDNMLGKNLYRFLYMEDGNATGFYANNIDKMHFGLIKIVEPENMRISLIVTDLGDYLLAYGVIGLDLFVIPGMENMINSSFTNRADAFFVWFMDNLKKYTD